MERREEGREGGEEEGEGGDPFIINQMRADNGDNVVRRCTTGAETGSISSVGHGREEREREQHSARFTSGHANAPAVRRVLSRK